MTFSIVARDREARAFGVASCTGVLGVGALVPFVSASRGAIATQAWVNVNLGAVGIELLRTGLGVRTALTSLLTEDKGRDYRQLLGIDETSTFAWTGPKCDPWAGHRERAECVVAGNILVGPTVVDAMVKSFEETKGALEERLHAALEAGFQAGGDRRGHRSACLLVGSLEPKSAHNLRVDDHPEPVKELRRIFEVAQAADRAEAEAAPPPGGFEIFRLTERLSQ